MLSGETHPPPPGAGDGVQGVLRAGLVDSGVVGARVATVPERYRPGAERGARWLACWDVARSATLGGGFVHGARCRMCLVACGMAEGGVTAACGARTR